MADERPGLAGETETPTGHRADPARARFWFIAAHRLIGAVLVILGMLAMAGTLDWGKGVGKVLAIVGLVDFFLIPLIFARMWKSVAR